MIRLTNYTGAPMTLLTGHVIPIGGHVDVDPQVVKANGNWLQGQIKRGLIGESEAVDMETEAVEAAPITRTDIRSMASDDVDDLLRMHGCETDGNLTERRERLIGAMFVDG